MLKTRRKGLRRSYLKRFSAEYVSVPRGITTGFAKEYHDRAKHIEERPVRLILGKDLTGHNVPRLTVAKQIEQLVNETVKEKRVCLQDTTLHKLWLYYNHCNEFFFMKKQSSHLLRSILYDSRGAAMAAFSRGSIVWIECIEPLRPLPSQQNLVDAD